MVAKVFLAWPGWWAAVVAIGNALHLENFRGDSTQLDCSLVGLQQTQSGSPDIQIACPLPDIGSLGPTVRYVAASPTKGAPAPDQEQSIAGRRLSGSTRPKAAGDVSGKLPFNA